MEVCSNVVLGWFDSQANFRQLHNEKIEFEKIEKWIDLKS